MPRPCRAAISTSRDRDHVPQVVVGELVVAGAVVEPLGVDPPVGVRREHDHEQPSTATPAVRAGRERSRSRRSGVAWTPITKNGSRPSTRAMSRVSPAKLPASRLIRPRPRSPPGPAATGRSACSAARRRAPRGTTAASAGPANRPSSCSSPTRIRKIANSASKIDVRHDDGRHQRHQPLPLPRERPRQVAGDEDEGRDVPGVQEVVEVPVEAGLREQGPHVPDHDECDQRHLGVVEPGIPHLCCGQDSLPASSWPRTTRYPEPGGVSPRPGQVGGTRRRTSR